MPAWLGVGEWSFGFFDVDVICVPEGRDGGDAADTCPFPRLATL